MQERWNGRNLPLSLPMDKDIPYNLGRFQLRIVWKQSIKWYRRRKKAKALDFLWWNGSELIWSLELVDRHQNVKLARSLPIWLELLQKQTLLRNAQKFSSFQIDDLLHRMNLCDLSVERTRVEYKGRYLKVKLLQNQSKMTKHNEFPNWTETKDFETYWKYFPKCWSDSWTVSTVSWYYT